MVKAQTSVSYKISAIITVYNAEEYFDTLIDNIRNQTKHIMQGHDVEVVIVDDCSTDATFARLQDVFRSYHHVKIIKTEQNGGAGHARNVGFRHSSGQYVLFLDSDDQYESNIFEKCLHALTLAQADIIFYQADRVDLTLNIEEKIHYPIFDQFRPYQIFSAMEVEGNIFDSATWWAWDRLFRRDFIAENHLEFQEIRLTNDLFFSAASFLVAPRIMYIDDVLLHHIENRKGSVSNSRSSSFACCLEALELLRVFLVKRGLWVPAKDHFYNYAITFLNWHLESISGPAFFPLYDQVKEFFQTNLNADANILFENSETLDRVLGSTALEYLEYLKSKFYIEKELLNKVNQYLIGRLQGN